MQFKSLFLRLSLVVVVILRQGLKFEFGAVTVDPQTLSYDPSPLKQYLASLSVPYFYESQCEYYSSLILKELEITKTKCYKQSNCKVFH